MSLSGVYSIAAGAVAGGGSGRAAIGVMPAIVRYCGPGVAGWPEIVVTRTPDARACAMTATADAAEFPRIPANSGMRKASLTIADTDSPALTLINGLAASTDWSAAMISTM